ncbi:hypothetical protein IFR05_002436 [Cadophora sp. M221]|nr:hypothetical protein IFR05_002436 [Cadophora sp. M221]
MSQEDYLKLDLRITLCLRNFSLFEDEARHPPPYGHAKTLIHPHHAVREEVHLLPQYGLQTQAPTLHHVLGDGANRLHLLLPVNHTISSAVIHSTASFLSFTQIFVNFSTFYQATTEIPKRSPRIDQEVGDLDLSGLDNCLNSASLWFTYQ